MSKIDSYKKNRYIFINKFYIEWHLFVVYNKKAFKIVFNLTKIKGVCYELYT